MRWLALCRDFNMIFRQPRSTRGNRQVLEPAQTNWNDIIVASSALHIIFSKICVVTRSPHSYREVVIYDGCGDGSITAPCHRTNRVNASC